MFVPAVGMERLPDQAPLENGPAIAGCSGRAKPTVARRIFGTALRTIPVGELPVPHSKGLPKDPSEPKTSARDWLVDVPWHSPSKLKEVLLKLKSISRFLEPL